MPASARVQPFVKPLNGRESRIRWRTEVMAGDAIIEPRPLTEKQVKFALKKNSSASPIPHSKEDVDGIDVKYLSTESVFLYKLESLVETRTIGRQVEQYDGRPIDGRENGAVPDVWDAPVTPPGNFVEGEVTYLMPHSEEVHLCTSCEGEGKIYCQKCRGYGRRRVSGHFVTNQKSVTPEKPCYKCKMSGQIKCKNCSGVGSFKSSLLMTVSWKKLSDEVYSGKSAADLTAGRLTKVRGVQIKSEWGQRVSPLVDYPVPQVAHDSRILHQKHLSSLPDSRIVEQRQTVEQVPVTVVNYGHKRRQSSFFVYGKEMEVFFPRVSPISRFYQWIGLNSCA